MGQKVNPHGMRVGVIKDWDSRWFTSKQAFGDTLVEDYKIRKTLKKQLYAAGVPKIEISVPSTARPAHPALRSMSSALSPVSLSARAVLRAPRSRSSWQS